MHAIIAEKKEQLVKLCPHYGVLRLEVFGSAARGLDFDPDTSDVDFLVEFHSCDNFPPFDQFFEFAEVLRCALGRPVELIEESAIENQYLLASINRSRKLIYVV